MAINIGIKYSVYDEKCKSYLNMTFIFQLLALTALDVPVVRFAITPEHLLQNVVYIYIHNIPALAGRKYYYNYLGYKKVF